MALETLLVLQNITLRIQEPPGKTQKATKQGLDTFGLQNLDWGSKFTFLHNSGREEAPDIDSAAPDDDSAHGIYALIQSWQLSF